MSGWFGGNKSGKSVDQEMEEKGEGPYSLTPEDNGDPRSVYVEDAGRKYRVATLQDFIRLRDQALSDEGWTERHREKNIVVLDKVPPPGSLGEGLNMVRVVNVFSGVSAHDLYDSLHDPDFRKTWDTNMLEGFCVCHLNNRNDVGYYAASMPWPLQNREFLNMRSWMEFTNGEYIIFNRSVIHADYPVTAKFVRALSYITGYYISPLNGGDKHSRGCRMIYMTHSNLGGSIPHALINLGYTKLCPGLMNKLETNANNYVEWIKEQGRDDTYVPAWRTAAVDWDPSKNAAAAAAAAKVAEEGPAATAAAAEGANVPFAGDATLRGAGGDDLAKTESGSVAGSDAALKAQIAELKKKLLAVEAQSLLSAEGSSLAPAAARRDDDPDSVQQFRVMLDDALNFVDRQYVHEGRSPASVGEYLLRLHSVVDGIRRTLREERIAVQ